MAMRLGYWVQVNGIVVIKYIVYKSFQIGLGFSVWVFSMCNSHIIGFYIFSAFDVWIAAYYFPSVVNVLPRDPWESSTLLGDLSG